LISLDTDLYERQGKALTNFERTLPADTNSPTKQKIKLLYLQRFDKNLRYA